MTILRAAPSCYHVCQGSESGRSLPSGLHQALRPRVRVCAGILAISSTVQYNTVQYSRGCVDVEVGADVDQFLAVGEAELEARMDVALWTGKVAAMGEVQLEESPYNMATLLGSH